MTGSIIDASDEFFNPVSSKGLRKDMLTWMINLIVKATPNPTSSTN
jgi:hypothetical protein